MTTKGSHVYNSQNFSGLIPDYIEDDDGDFYVSHAVAWIFVYRDNGEWEQFPRDMVNDPAMTVMLMQRGMLDAWIVNGGWMVGTAWMNGTVRMISNTGQSNSLGRAVAEAFAKAQAGETE